MQENEPFLSDAEPVTTDTSHSIHFKSQNQTKSSLFGKFKAIVAAIFQVSKEKAEGEVAGKKEQSQKVAHLAKKLQSLKEHFEKKDQDVFERVATLIDPLLKDRMICGPVAESDRDVKENPSDCFSLWVNEATVLVEHLEPLTAEEITSKNACEAIVKMPIKKLVNKEVQFISNYMKQQLSAHQLDQKREREFAVKVVRPLQEGLEKLHLRIDHLSMEQLRIHHDRIRETFYNDALQLVDDFFEGEEKVHAAEDHGEFPKIVHELPEE